MTSDYQIADDYSNMYFRKYLGQTGPNPTNNAVTISPDIIPFYKDTPDPGTFITPANWARDMGKGIAVQEYNNVYVRGNNNSGSAQESWVELNYSPSNLVMWPNNWADLQIPLATDPGKFRLPVSASPSSLWVGNQPFQWMPPQLPAGADHFCLVSRLNEPVPTVQFSWNDLINWIKKPNVGWRNVNLVKGDTPSWERRFNLNIPQEAKVPEDSQVWVFLDFKNVPVGISAAFSCPDPKADPIINQPKTELKTPSQIIGQWTSLPVGFSSWFTVSFWNNGIAIPPGASVSINLYYSEMQLSKRELLRLNAVIHEETIITHRTLMHNTQGIPMKYVGAIHNNWQ